MKTTNINALNERCRTLGKHLAGYIAGKTGPEAPGAPAGRALWAAALLAAAAGSAAPARAGQIAPDLLERVKTQRNAAERVRVIVQRRGGVTAAQLAQAHGGRALAEHRLIQGVTLELPLRAVEALAKNPNVAVVSPDRQVIGATTEYDYDVETTGAKQVWSTGGHSGFGVGIAVLDTGVNPNQGDFSRQTTPNSKVTRVVGWKDMVAGKSSPYDDHGHGTHVAAVAVGNGARSQWSWTGSAPDANLVAVKVLDAQGKGTVSGVISGLEWCVANRGAYNIRVVNLSLGHLPRESTATDPLCAAVRKTVQAGIVVVCAAGNHGTDGSGTLKYGGIHTPGNEPAALTVGALNTKGSPDRRDDVVTSYSSRGPTYKDHHLKPDVVAPGNRILGGRAEKATLDVTYPENRTDYDAKLQNGIDYYTLSGTSMAAPQVAGIAALMLQANPLLAPNTVKGILMYTAERLALKDASGVTLSAGLSVLTQGAGSVNAVGAVEVARKIDPRVGTGGYWLTGALSNGSTIGEYAFSWSKQVLYRDQVIWGDAVMSVRQVIWGDQCLWGDQVIWGDQCLWGENGVSHDQVIWGDQCLWGDQVLWGDNVTLTALSNRALIRGE